MLTRKPTKKEMNRIHKRRREQVRLKVVMKRRARMDAELIAITGPAFNSVSGLATRTVPEGFGKVDDVSQD